MAAVAQSAAHSDIRYLLTLFMQGWLNSRAVATCRLAMLHTQTVSHASKDNVYLLACLAVLHHYRGDARKSLLDKLQGYDYDPSAQPDEEYPDDSISQIADDEHRVSLLLSTNRRVA